SMRYLGESLAILKAIDSPMLTLMSVANPWMRGSPDPLMSHSVEGFPALQFSATILLGGFVHALAACGARCALPERAARPTVVAASNPHANAIGRAPRVMGRHHRRRENGVQASRRSAKDSSLTSRTSDPTRKSCVRRN